ncbi:hypothetical protein EDB92DRAFT_2100302 [Lactarius akahatsu]|uniref:Uncharacterized protein n=1 Tax=Lactarius akahatsu TaxID=416441 RepID=A0AAD4LP96_9AGAM|nr:hypothetical protein EDB92DRAFT_2100302 [Lactarius akahatsu]
MDAQIRVFIPWLSTLRLFPRDKISSVGDLLTAIWTEEVSPLSQGIRLSHCSLRTLLVPVPMEPRDTLQKRVMRGTRVNGWAVNTKDTDAVPPGWSNTEILHVYLYIHLGPEVQVAEQLYKTLWGEDLNVILEEISDVDGTTWKYVPKTHINSLQKLGYTESCGLLLRSEYDITYRTICKDSETAKARQRGGVVVTGQLGIGKTCFLYYILLRRLSEMEPVALERPEFFILFHDGGVYRYPKADPDFLPKSTWALTDSTGQTPEPCSAFQTVSKRLEAWIIQTTSPAVTRWRDWHKYCKADMFVMNPISIKEITILGKLLKPDDDVSDDLQRLYGKWGPSARTCFELLAEGKEDTYEREVKRTAIDFVKSANPNFDQSKVSHHLFSVRPVGQSRAGREDQIAEIATDHIRDIISYAAADASAQVRIDFFQMMSTHPSFKAPAGTMFEGFVLSWLYARPDAEPFRCIATNQAELEIPACGKEQTTFFDRNSVLTKKDVNGWDKSPLCLLPKPKNFPTANAIVITDEFVITIQVTISNEHGAKKEGFDEIKKIIPTFLQNKKNKPKQKKPWRHVFITHSDSGAEFLREQNLPGLPDGTLVFSGVFDILRSGVKSKHMEAFNKRKKQSRNSMEVD